MQTGQKSPALPQRDRLGLFNLILITKLQCTVWKNIDSIGYTPQSFSWDDEGTQHPILFPRCALRFKARVSLHFEGSWREEENTIINKAR